MFRTTWPGLLIKMHQASRLTNNLQSTSRVTGLSSKQDLVPPSCVRCSRARLDRHALLIVAGRTMTITANSLEIVVNTKRASFRQSSMIRVDETISSASSTYNEKYKELLERVVQRRLDENLYLIVIRWLPCPCSGSTSRLELLLSYPCSRQCSRLLTTILLC
jgi:hypothetical protein